MGFNRRYTDYPGSDVLAEIEGIVTIDASPPPSINGVVSGVVAVMGEFADVTYGVAIDSNGVVSTKANPVEILSGQDLLDKVGGFDETLGEFGGDMGNGFIEVKNKTFSRLVLVPINVAASQGARLWRKLPTNTSASNASPVVPIVGGVVQAGREFRSGSNRVRLAARVVFAETADYARGIDGVVVSTGTPAATQSIAMASGTFLTVLRPDGSAGVKVGDILVYGVIGGAAALGANADTYRVATVTDATHITVGKMDGSNFDWTSGTGPWRLHIPACADTGAALLTAQSGYRIPVRPLDATVAINTALTPTLVPDALTALSADALSGLTMRSAPVTGIVYVANVHAPNVASNATLDALYQLAINSLLADDLPEREVNLVESARASTNIQIFIKAHVLAQKANGIGRVGVYSPPLDTLDLASAIGDTAPGVGAARARELIYAWPGVQTFVGEAVGTPIKGADGNTYTDGMVDVPSGGWLNSIMSQLAPERNPGQSSDPVKTIMSLVQGLQRGLTTTLGINEYKQMRAKGICGPRNDRSVGMVFQSGVTSSLLSGEAEIYTRRFSFYVEDSITEFLMPFSKEPMTESLKDKIVGAFHDFFDDLQSVLNPSAARIAGYAVDPKSGNTKELSKKGIYVVKYACEMIPIANTIVQEAHIGYGVLDIITKKAA